MPGPHPSVARVRRAVRADLPRAGVVAVACSGGADSLALLAATVFEAPEEVHVLGVTVDHGLQDGSRERAQRVVAQMAELGADETLTATVTVDPGGLGVEAAARRARYAVLDEIAQRFEATVLLGHTRDDQAETVLLGLARGSGGRSLAGMRRAFGPYRRPLLDVGRLDTETACRAEGIEFWEDPHNVDPAFTRVRVRTRVLPVLEDQLGPGVAQALARTADQLRPDMELLDALADEQAARPDALDVATLATMPASLRTRVLRRRAVAAGAIDAELTYEHVTAIDRLVTAWHGQGPIDLPGHLRAVRSGGGVAFERG